MATSSSSAVLRRQSDFAKAPVVPSKGANPGTWTLLRHIADHPLFIAQSIVALLVVALIAFAILTTMTTREKSRTGEFAGLTQVNAILAEHVYRVMYGADLLATSLVDRLSIDGIRSPEQFRRVAGSREIHNKLREQLEITSDVEALSYVDAVGRLVNTSRSWPNPPLNVADRKYFVMLRDNPAAALYISEPLTSRITGQTLMFLVRPIRARNGTFLGAALVAISSSHIEKLFSTARTADEVSISLHRRDGTLLVGELRSAAGAPLDAGSWTSFQKDMPNAERAQYRENEGGADVSPELVTLQAVDGYPLVVRVARSEALALQAWQELSKLLLAFAAAAVVLILMLVLALLRTSRMQHDMLDNASRLEHANDELQASNRDLESFGHSIAHDLRSPLRVIRGLSAGALAEKRHHLDGELARDLDSIVDGATRMGAIINDLLRLSRLANQELVRRDLDIGAFANDVIAGLAAAEPGRRVDCFVAENLLANGDPGLIRVCLDNLIGNAWKFTSRVKGARIEVGSELCGGETVFHVRDNGAGFDMRRADKLFITFQRLHHRDEFDGTGIGLSIVHRIIRRHGGRIWAESEQGKGSVFRFTLGHPG